MLEELSLDRCSASYYRTAEPWVRTEGLVTSLAAVEAGRKVYTGSGHRSFQSHHDAVFQAFLVCQLPLCPSQKRSLSVRCPAHLRCLWGKKSVEHIQHGPMSTYLE